MTGTLSEELFDAPTRRHIVTGAIVMFVLNALLFWLPLLGPLLAGFVGGKLAGGIAEGVIAALVPGLIVGALLFVLGSAITGVALIGVIAAAGGLWLALSNVGVLVLGAIIGGVFAT